VLAKLRSELLGSLCSYVRGETPAIFSESDRDPDSELVLAIRVCLPQILSAQLARRRAFGRREWSCCLAALVHFPATPAAADDLSGAGDFVAARLLAELGVSEGIELEGAGAHPMSIGSSIEDFCRVGSIYCELAHPALSTALGDRARARDGVAAQAACLSFMHGRPLEAARLARWWAISKEDGPGSELRKQFLRNLRRFAGLSREIEFQLAISEQYAAG
jgi:hypothetical protein